MFEYMEIEIFYEGIVDNSYKTTQADANFDGHSRKMRVVLSSSKRYSHMISHDGKCRKRYVDRLSEGSELTCTIYGPGHYSEHCKVLNNFITRYDKISPSKESRHEPTFANKYQKNKEVNDMVQHEVDDILQ